MSLRRIAVAATSMVVVALVLASPAAAANPTVTIDQAAGQIDPSPAHTLLFIATFSKPVTGFTETDVLLSGALSAAVIGGPTTYTVEVSGMTAPGLVVASIPAFAAEDAASNPSEASTSADNEITWYVDTTPPTVTIDAAAAQADPASTAPIFFTARFSESVTDFTASDVLFSGTSAGGSLAATVTGGPTVYDVAVSGMTGAGNVVATIPAGAALDPAGNPSLASTSIHNSVAWQPPAADGGNPSGTGATPTPILARVPPAPSLRLLSTCRAKHPCKVAKGARVLPLRVACGPPAGCVGTLLLAADHKVLGKLDFHLSAGTTATLRMPLLHRAARLLAARPKIAAELEIRLGGHSTSRHLTLKR
jgi:hypothetical protein